jgi:hypothetical protein
VYVRADQFVYRLSPGDSVNVSLYATRYGAPYAQAQVIPVVDPSGLQGPTPPVGLPATAIHLPPSLTTDRNGRATLTITVSAPGNPRQYIDGQLYGVRPALMETVSTPGLVYHFDPWAFISVLVWDAYAAHTPPTWHGDLQPIFQQYWNLYPVMDSFLNLADPASLWEHRAELQQVFELSLADPNSMPVTRDLSPAKRRAILAWLSAPEPVIGDEPAAPPHSIRSGAAAPARALPTNAGKAAAASRRLGMTPPGRG